MLENFEAISSEVELLQSGRHTDPHRFLGLHTSGYLQKYIRFWAPLKKEYHFSFRGKIVAARLEHEAGLFVYFAPEDTTRDDYQIQHENGKWGHDPYSFMPIISHVDSHLFNHGIHYTIYEVLGSHVRVHQGIEGVTFAVWAPNATRVSLIADCNHWKERVFPMRLIQESGIWEIFIPGLSAHEKYKFAIRDQFGHVKYKTDPYAHQFELRPKTAAIVSPSSHFDWSDEEWMHQRTTSNPLDGPINIYEMHLGSWMKKKEHFHNYREIAEEVVLYLQEMGYTHLEILPITEHPLDESWGYQVSGYFAPTSRYGTLEDFQYFVNYLHIHHIGVILDWAPGYFPADDFSLSYFDGKALYEKDHPEMGRHPHWGGHIFNYKEKKVANFLIASALFWFQKMHIDGMRVDAVQSMLFLDYGRAPGTWVPNEYGGNENHDAIEFLKHLNSIVHERCPGVFTIAEDASIYPGITKPVEWGGLGFDMKWSLGWMNDTLKFMKCDPIHRKYHMHELLRSFSYMYEERYLLPISHDEVVHEKRNLIEKMPLDDWCKFAQLRLYYSAAICHPGKNLFFMGIEIGQRREWDCKGELDWNILHDEMHSKWKKFVSEMNHFYVDHSPLWEIDFHEKGFAWIDYNDYNHSIISYLRKGIHSELVCVHNYTPTHFSEYVVRLRNVLQIREVMNSDDEKYGGSGCLNQDICILPDKSGFQIKMPPLATMIFEVVFDGRDKKIY